MHDAPPASDGNVPDTSTALLRDLAAGPDARRWTEFAALYAPVLRHWLHCLRQGPLPALEEDMFDDIVQETFVSLVKVFPDGGYRRDRARFRTFLSAVLRRRAVDALRRSGRRVLRVLPSGKVEALADAAADAFPAPAADDPDGRELRARLWRFLVERVFRESRFSERSKRVFLRLAAGEPPSALAREFGLAENAVYQLKSRVLKALAAEARTLPREPADLFDLVAAFERGVKEDDGV